MSAQPPSGHDLGAYEVIHLGGQAAVVLPVADFRRLKALEAVATEEALQDAEDMAALQEWRERRASGLATCVPADEVRHRLGLPR